MRVEAGRVRVWLCGARHGRAGRGETWLGSAGRGKVHFLLGVVMTTRSIKSDTRLEFVTRRVVLDGIREIMFDRYAGDNKTKLSWWEKIYLKPGTNVLCIPTININSFFTAHNTNSAPKRLRDKRAYKDICNAIQSFVSIDAPDGSQSIPIMRNGQPIQVGSFGESLDPVSGIYLHRSVARLDKGIPNPKERPVLPLPWSIEFNLTIMPNEEIKEAEIRNLLVDGGIAIGLGTYRGQFGKFSVAAWE